MNQKVTLFAIFLAFVLLTSGCGSGTKEELYAEGLQLMEQGNFQGAVVVFRNALEKDQNFFPARFQLARVYLGLNRFELAEQELRKVRLQNPSDPEIALEMAQVFLFTDRLSEAREEITTYLAHNPDSVPAILILGEIYGRETNLDQAKQRFQQVLSITPGEPSAHLGLARIALIQGETDQALSELRAILDVHPDHLQALYILAEIQQRQGQIDELQATMSTIARLNPQDVTTKYRLGMIYLDKGEIAMAAELGKQLREQHPRRSEGFTLNGLKFFQEGNFPEAIVALQQANSIQPSLENHYYLGLSLYQTGELESALSEFRIALGLRPDFVQARLMTALILLQQQRLEPALIEAQRVIQQSPGNAMAYNIQGSALMAMGNHDQGLEALRTATRLNPGLVDSYLKQGIFHLSQGSTEEAGISLDAAIQAAPDQMQIRMLQFANLMQQGEMDKAYALMQDGLDGTANDASFFNNMAAIDFSRNNPAEALALLDRAQQSNPAFLPAYFNKAAYFTTRGDLAAAFGQYQAALEQAPDNPRALLGAATTVALLGREDEALDYYSRARDTGSPQAFLASAEHLLRRGQPDQALTILDSGITTTEDNLPLLEAKGRILLGQREYDQAIAVFRIIQSRQEDSGLQLLASAYLQKEDTAGAMEQARRLIAARPDSAGGYLLLASIHEVAGNLDQAEAQIQAATKAEPENLQALLRMGNLQARRGNLDQAMEAFQGAERLNPDFAPAIFSQGSLLESQGRYAQAILAHQRALSKDPGFAPSLNNLAYLYLKGHGDPAEALSLANRAFQAEPNNPGIMDTLGLALLKNDQAEEGRRVLEQAVELLPDHPTVRFHLAMAYDLTGEPDKALKELEKALAHDDFPEIRDARALKERIGASHP